MTPTVHHLGPGNWALYMSAAWAQVWSPVPAPVNSGVVEYRVTRFSEYPRDDYPLGMVWHVAHVTADEGGIALAWPGAGPLWVTYAPVPLEYATEPYPAAWWAGPGDFDVDGIVTITDLLCYLDWWFAESGDPVWLADFVSEWIGS